MQGLLEYPFDAQRILRKRKAIKRQLLAEKTDLIEKKIAILGGSTTHDIRDILELFLLSHGIAPTFYESEFGRYWEDAMFLEKGEACGNFDVIFIHTGIRNIRAFPELGDSSDAIEEKLEKTYSRFSVMWERLRETFGCPIIQNNFELPYFRLLGNRDGWDEHGRVNFVTRLNMKFSDYAREHEGFYINDIHYLSASYGLDKWSDPFYWHMYKYAQSMEAIPYLCHNVANIIKSIFGKNKKTLALDLDNTLWGGVVGDDGVENLALGPETPMGQMYGEFQAYLKALKNQGILLNVVSKNDYENAIAGLNHPDGILRPEDFIDIKANWEPKSVNLTEQAKALELLPESFVFVDDNPAEREIVRQQVPGAAVPEMGEAERYITVLDKSGFFEVTALSGEDMKRSEMYKENLQRAQLQESFADYEEYLRSLDMTARIGPFEPMYMARIAQLTNKSNQFNLTTRRFTQEEIERVGVDEHYITLSGRLQDRFGDNGVVSVVIGKIEERRLHILLWLMSCRVLKRDMEFAMMDELVAHAQKRGIDKLLGYYYPTAKNGMVRDFYKTQGFRLLAGDEQGNTVWELDISEGYEKKQNVIKISDA